MALTFLYRDLDATDTDVTPYVVLRFGQNPQGMAENAEERSVGSWDLEIEDNGVLDLHAQRTFYVLEDDTDYADNVLWVGQTFDKHSVRGDTWRTGPGRVYTLNLIDLNTLLERRVIQSGDDPDRPEETDVERMLWLQGLGYIGVTDDWISTANPVDMDAVDYTGRMASEVIEDCMQQSTKNAFMFRDPDTDTFAVFYGDSSADIDVLTSDIRLSNVLSDIDNVTTFEVNLDADQWEANSRIYSGIFGNYDGGAVYVENAVTVANFSHRDTTLSWPDVKTATKATARATRQLAIIGTEEIRITAALEVGSGQVGLFPHAGWRLQAKFSHFPRFADHFTWMRILSRNTTLIGPNRYRIQYELSPGPAAAPPVSCAAVVGAIDSWDSTEQHHVDAHPTINVAPSLSPSTASMVICLWACVNNSEPVAGDFPSPPTESMTGFTMWGNSRDTYADDYPSLALAGYKAGTGSPGTMGCIFTNPTSSAARSWRAIAMAIETSATGFVQVAPYQDGTGSTVTFASPLTVGNLLVLAKYAETGFATPDPPSGFTRVQYGTFTDNGFQFSAVELCVRCIEEGDSQTVTVGDSNQSHWAFCAELAL